MTKSIRKSLIRKSLIRKSPLRKSPLRKSLKYVKKIKSPRKMSKTYCKKTPCRKMGFSQKASCRPYKNCYAEGSRPLTTD